MFTRPKYITLHHERSGVMGKFSKIAIYQLICRLDVGLYIITPAI
jgi:hypothetical protein